MISKTRLESVLDAAVAAGEDAIKDMHDGYPCGGAYLMATGNSEIVRAFKKYATKHSDYLILNMIEGKPLNGQRWSVRKSYPKGYCVNDPVMKGGGFQNMYMHEAVARAQKKVLDAAGLFVSVRSYID